MRTLPPTGNLLAGLASLLLLAGAAQASSIVVNGVLQESSNVTSTSPPAAAACLEGDGHQHCYIVFSRVPIGKQLTVTQVSCQLSVSGGDVTQLYLRPQRASGTLLERFQFLTSTVLPTAPSGANIVVNNTAFQLFDERERPLIFIQLNIDGSVSGFCSITGPLTDKPA